MLVHDSSAHTTIDFLFDFQVNMNYRLDSPFNKTN